MKQLLFLCLLIPCCYAATAQYDAAIRYRDTIPTFYVAMDTLIGRARIDTTDTTEGGQINQLSRFKYFMGSRICNDVAVGEDMYYPMDAALSSYFSSFSSYCPGTGSGNWTCVGPFNNDYGGYEQQGRVDAIWVHPTDTNFILVGSNGGGLWKTNNGGISWKNLTDGSGSSASSVLGMAGVSTIAISPIDTNIIYIGLRGREESKKTGGYNLGLAYTTDGGTTWYQDVSFNSLITSTHIAEVTKIRYRPGTQELYAISEGKVLYKASTVSSWTDITPSPLSGGGYWCNDMDFIKTSPYKFVVVSSALSNTSHLLIHDGGSSWTNVSMVLPSPYSQANYKGPKCLSITGDGRAYVWFAAKNGSADVSMLVRTPMTTFSADIRNSAFSCPYTVGICSLQEVRDLCVSPANPDIVYAANYNGWMDQGIYKSTDGGATFPYSFTSHADGRCLFIHSATNTSDGVNDVVYNGNDGGIRKKRYGNSDFSSITGAGLCITQFFGFGNTEADEHIMTAGAQDNGGFAYIESEPVPWLHIKGGDGYTAKFMKDGITKAFGEVNSEILPMPLYGIEFSIGSVHTYTVPTPSDIAISNINRPLHFDPLSNDAYVGYSHIWKKALTASSWSNPFPGGQPINGISGTEPEVVVDFFINEKNADTVYIAYRDPKGTDAFGRLFISKKATHATSPDWVDITPPTVSVVNGINSIAVDPKNSRRIWVAYGNVNQAMVGTSPSAMEHRVMYSDDFGATWTDVSTGLSALPVGKLLYRDGSDDELYAGTDVGVFKWNKSLSQWECFNLGLPSCAVMDMEINYCAGKLRIATFGRGIWESPLPGIVHYPSTVISSGITPWNSDMWLQSSVEIKNGATLIITGHTIHMPKDGKILVRPGGKLVVDNATLTNSCDGCMWHGIQAEGSPTLPQTTANQAWVVIKNGSTIEHATEAVSNYTAARYRPVPAAFCKRKGATL